MCIGQKENEEMKLKSILAQLDYHHRIICWTQKGILFQAYMYVPETNPITGCTFHEREDEGHVLKVNNIISSSCIADFILCTSHREWHKV